ncbi:MAG: D-glycero-beta-D-manno-heptose 1,7-bisphosphate 7-phosphatase [Planctomycetota bacterium]|nr:D-glycero-beta-D-manno-heptose 1,7-bisphosphate 7-phosphatase [Planctomycetota bacterium]
MSSLAPAVFLDRDGTLIEEVDYLADPAGVVLIPGAAQALKNLAQAGYKLVLVTNQSGVARGLLDEGKLAQIHERLSDLLHGEGTGLDGIYACIHHPEFGSPCDCRKPQPGMLLQAAEDLQLDLKRSWMIGDAARDLEAGKRAGARSLLVRTGKGSVLARERKDEGITVTEDLGEAARWILAQA